MTLTPPGCSPTAPDGSARRAFRRAPLGPTRRGGDPSAPRLLDVSCGVCAVVATVTPRMERRRQTYHPRPAAYHLAFRTRRPSRRVLNSAYGKHERLPLTTRLPCAATTQRWSPCWRQPSSLPRLLSC